MTSVIRVLQYTKLDKEGPFETLSSKKPTREWPHSGKIIFKKVLYLRYAPEDPPILKTLNLEIKPGEKLMQKGVGIVEDNAGKSSLIYALFRLTNIEGYLLNGRNDLRSNISITSQEPILFPQVSDPFEKSSDEEIWRALENVSITTYYYSYVTMGESKYIIRERKRCIQVKSLIFLGIRTKSENTETLFCLVKLRSLKYARVFEHDGAARVLEIEQVF
ncbi:hypothetical protein NQ317_015664 [Molorchus minor]|uniref:ABC transporter domain-containing protein n=1 Tax=Molorchus minor TaxID=1323400 RepID=A0ABQ9J6A0_9CUCU|nr:hypothetical protein NQ317_015664 [Molorchus minor]